MQAREVSGVGRFHREFAVVVAGDKGRSILELHGELDAATAPDLEQYLDAIIEVQPGDVVLDLAALEFIDSTGIGIILDGVARLRAGGRDLMLRTPSPLVRKTLDTCGVGGVVAVDDGHAS